MKSILLVGHGDLPGAMKSSVQMIVGEQENIHVVSLAPEDGKEDLARKLAEAEEGMSKSDGVLVLADILGGSPCTAALEKYLEDEEVSVVTGMNLPMVLSAAMDELSGRELISASRNAIVDAKMVTAEPSDEVAASADSLPNDPERPHNIVGVRVDARGIHGQVAATWIPSTHADRVIVIDDAIVGNSVQKMALRMAKPQHVKLSILSADRAAERLSDPGSYPGERVFVVIVQVSTIGELSRRGLLFKEINMGNVPNRADAKPYAKTVYLTDDERSVVKQAMDNGTRFTVRQVPADPIENFELRSEGER